MKIDSMKSVIGLDLTKILVEQLTVYQRGDGWEYHCGGPVLHFQSVTDPAMSLYWDLSWTETEDGDDQLLIEVTEDAESLSCFERVDWMEQLVTVGSSIRLENSSVQRAIAYGYKDDEKEFLTSIVFELEHEYVTCYSGPFFTMAVSSTIPENMDSTLYSAGEFE
ncbi:hypothetical protein [Sporosarcina sp. A2]|uniref:hypothetical protein n=1 Tax=Sporosarcina sp. A2 TaxID=3393449 RepID=UPI003D7AD5A4